PLDRRGARLARQGLQPDRRAVQEKQPAEDRGFVQGCRRACRRDVRTAVRQDHRSASACRRRQRARSLKKTKAVEPIRWRGDRMKGAKDLEAEAKAIYEEDLAANRTMGKLGAELIPERARIMTHCNAGALATAGYGTALGVVRSAKDKKISVIACETRPYLQG